MKLNFDPTINMMDDGIVLTKEVIIVFVQLYLQHTPLKCTR